MLTFCLLIIAVVAYLLGGVNGAIITSRYLYRKDIRQFGSGNAGLTNFYRVFGKKGTAIVIAVDALKAIIAVALGGLLMKPFGAAVTGKTMAMFFAMLGHAFPVYYGFHGGKTVLCGGFCALMLDWRIGLMCWGVFLIAVIATRYVSLGSICAGIVLPLGVVIFKGEPIEILLAAMSGLLLVGMHWQNILRLLVGKENKFSFSSGGAAKEAPARPSRPEARERAYQPRPAQSEAGETEAEARERQLADSIRKKISSINWYEDTDDDE
jgi:glycerol-3-phosphate acyltransferase PlsY